MIYIDGSKGEGGGQIIRSALTMAAITGQSFEIENIRENREPPGLKHQHLGAARLVRKICRGTLKGDEVGSRELTYEPGRIIGGKYDFDIGTAGSVTLLAQTIIPILLKAEKESRVKLTGGTHVLHSPGYDYFEQVFIQAIRNMGADVSSEMILPGYYPRGGGSIELRIKPSEITGQTNWETNETKKAIIRISNLPMSIAIREKKVLLDSGYEDIRIMEDDTYSPGNSVTLWSGFRGSYVPGKKGKRAETVASEAVENLEKETGDVDSNLADQLLIYGVLSDGRTCYSTSELTRHLRTNRNIISQFSNVAIEFEDKKIRIG